MKVTISFASDFLKAAKRLAKKYQSFKSDLKKFEEEIKENPQIGTDLGGGVRKIRLAITSKGKGKRGGARVITLNLILKEEETQVRFLYIYDKSEMENISKEKIEELIRDNPWE